MIPDSKGIGSSGGNKIRHFMFSAAKEQISKKIYVKKNSKINYELEVLKPKLLFIAAIKVPYLSH